MVANVTRRKVFRVSEESFGVLVEGNRSNKYFLAAILPHVIIGGVFRNYVWKKWKEGSYTLIRREPAYRESEGRIVEVWVPEIGRWKAARVSMFSTLRTSQIERELGPEVFLPWS